MKPTPTPTETGSAVAYVLEDGEGEVIRWFGDTITVKASGPSFDVAVVTAVAGSEPPPHVHAEADEALYVLDGAITVHAGSDTVPAPAGSFVFLPRTLPHSFTVETGSARLLLIVQPAGAVVMFSEVEERFGARAMPARLSTEHLADIASALRSFDVTVVNASPGSAS